ncbi:hypothetical protein [Nesterenkonia cremea]|uniref:Uncharacterized protein n=1 Tax=Nesterenkonia cremea TaxID=1882340 RepID=A0A917AX42_9MICC|nr:hypothetical protein [Nesterenkonia cremea]GGE77253.1 hypothetical protein GCM10011401_25730 [Nesterenkonia cremea]
MASTVTITPHTHWMNGWVLRPLAVPVIRIDGTDHPVTWGRAAEIEVSVGAHTIGVGARYRGTGSVLGMEETTVEVGESQTVVLEARNGLFNHQPFTITQLGSAQFSD